MSATDDCLVEGCSRAARSRGWCNRHYENWRKYGNPVAQRERPLAERIAAVGWTVTAAGCWEWRGSRNALGYPLYRRRRVHRIVYELHTGESPEVVRHRCDNPPCVNPDHLEGGTQGDNMRDMMDRGRHYKQQASTCPNDHDLTLRGATKTVRGRSSKTYQACVLCDRARKAAWDQRNRGRAA